MPPLSGGGLILGIYAGLLPAAGPASGQGATLVKRPATARRQLLNINPSTWTRGMADGKDPFQFGSSAFLADQIKKLAEGPRVNLPDLSYRPPEVIRMPSQREVNAYQSAGVLVKSMAATVAQWRAQVPADSQPVVLAILQGGVQVNVTMLAEESFHVLRIQGSIDGNPCMLLTHQASVQLLCMVVKVEDESKRRSIGFIIGGQETKA